MRHSFVAALAMAVAVSGAVSGTALAQTPAAPTPGNQQDMLKMMHLAAHNQLGILEYCQSQGNVDADTVVLQRRLIGMLPPAQVDGLDAAEAMGKKGTVSFGGNQVEITAAAKAQNTTPAAMCKQIATMLQAQATQLPK